MKIGYLTSSKIPRGVEDRSAWEWISKEKGIKATRLLPSEIKENPRILDRCDLLWWHEDEAVEIPPDFNEEATRKAINAYLRRGGSLLLSLLASQYVVNLGLEPAIPNVVRKGEWDQESWVKDYPDIRGLGSNQGHPIFAGLAGAAAEADLSILRSSH